MTNIRAQSFVWLFLSIFLGCVPVSRVAGSCGGCVAELLKNHQTFPKWLCPSAFAPARNEGMRVPLSARSLSALSHQCMLLAVILILDIIREVRWCPIMVSVCPPGWLMTLSISSRAPWPSVYPWRNLYLMPLNWAIWLCY